MTVRVHAVRIHRHARTCYWRWTCDDPDCQRTDSASTWDEAMEGATGHAVYQHGTDLARINQALGGSDTWWKGCP